MTGVRLDIQTQINANSRRNMDDFEKILERWRVGCCFWEGALIAAVVGEAKKVCTQPQAHDTGFTTTATHALDEELGRLIRG